MISENSKTLMLVVWSVAVILTAIASGVTAVSNWIVVAALAGVLPLVVRSLWRAPEQTISERIHEARR
jgi:hypothetical protein